MNLGGTAAENRMRADDADRAVADLVAESRNGDSRAFESLYRLHAGRVHALCLRLTGDPARAEALTQDVFVKVWRKLDSFRAEGPFAAWLRRLTVNTALEDRRSAKRESIWLAPDGDGLIRAGAGGAGTRTGPDDGPRTGGGPAPRGGTNRIRAPRRGRVQAP